MDEIIFLGLPLLLLLVAGHASDSSSVEQAGEYSLLVQLPNVSIPVDAAYICTSVLIPESSYIVEMAPQPVEGEHAFFSLIPCEPDFASPTDGSPAVWDCGFPTYHGSRLPGLEPGNECKQTAAASGRTVYYQYQGAPVDEASVRLPPGTGVRVGPGSGLTHLVGVFHFPNQRGTLSGFSGSPGIHVKLVREQADHPLKPVYSMLLGASGVLAPQAVGSVTAAWTLREQVVLHPLRLTTHWHNLAIDIRVLIKKEGGSSQLLLQHDPHPYRGFIDVPAENPVIISEGDQLSIVCTYNNTLTQIVDVVEREMCVVALFYSMDGDARLPTQVISMDPAFRNCSTLWKVEALGVLTGVNYEGASSFHTSERGKWCPEG